MKAILDTSFLLECAEKKKDAFAEVEKLVEEKTDFLIPESVFGELKSLAGGGGKRARAAKLVLKIIEARKKEIKKIKTNARKSDEAVRELVEKFSREQTLACTNDYKLRQSLRNSARLACITRDGRITGV